MTSGQGTIWSTVPHERPPQEVDFFFSLFFLRYWFAPLAGRTSCEGKTIFFFTRFFFASLRSYTNKDYVNDFEKETKLCTRQGKISGRSVGRGRRLFPICAKRHEDFRTDTIFLGCFSTAKKEDTLPNLGSRSLMFSARFGTGALIQPRTDLPKLG